MICTTCGRDNADSLVFCEECGQRLKPRVAPATAPAEPGVRSDEGSSRVTGGPEDERTSPPPSRGSRPAAPDLKLGPAVARPASAPCPVCGTVNPGDMRFCISCGTNLDKVRAEAGLLATRTNTDPAPGPGAMQGAPAPIAPQVAPQMRVVEIGPLAAQTSRTCLRCHGQNDPVSNFCKFCGNHLVESSRLLAPSPEVHASADPLGPQASPAGATPVAPPAPPHAATPPAAIAPSKDPIGARIESLSRTRIDEGVVKVTSGPAGWSPAAPFATPEPALAAPVQVSPSLAAPMQVSPPPFASPQIAPGPAAFAPGGPHGTAPPGPSPAAFSPLGTHWGAQPSAVERAAFSGGTAPPEGFPANRGPTAGPPAFPDVRMQPLEAPRIDPIPVAPSRGGPLAPTAPPPQARPQGTSVGRIVMVARDGRPGPDFSIVEQLDIGRTEGDVRIPEDPYLSPRHARLRTREGQMWLQDLGSINGVYLRLSRVRAPRLEGASASHKPNEIVTLLGDQDLILAGQQVLRFELVRDGEAGFGPAVERGVHLFGTPSAKRHARICQRAVEGTTLDVHYLRKHETVLGREQGDLIYGDDPFLSRRHAAVRVDGTMQDRRYYLVDLGSSNGTFIRTRSDMQVFDGDHFRVGHQLFRIELFGGRAS